MSRTKGSGPSLGRRSVLRMLALTGVGASWAPGSLAGRVATESGSTPGAPDWRLMVLGIAQDGGMPHPGCLQPPCSDVRAGRRRAEKIACLGLLDRAGTAAYLFDATPDLPAQLGLLTGGRMPDGIFLTHAHIGHYTGLMYLGKEAAATRRIPVYATRRMSEFLTVNGPWSLLVKDAHISLQPLEPGHTVSLPGGISVTPIQVPHRDEFSDTVGFLVEGPRARALFVPDTDRWESWSQSIRETVNRVDYALVDGTFSSPGEVGARDITAIAHPMMPVTRDLLRGVRAQVWFIHLNHTNPAIIDGTDVAREGMTFPI